MSEFSFHDLSRRSQVLRLRYAVARLLTDAHCRVLGCRFIEHQHNTTFRVEERDGRTTFLRISRAADRSPAMINAEVNWLHDLAGKGFPVAAPIPWPGGEFIQEMDRPGLGERRVVTRFEWRKGAVNWRPSSQQFAAIGEVMARLHEHTLSRTDLGLGRWEVDGAIGNQNDPALAMSLVETELGREARMLLERVINLYQSQRTSIGPVQLLHGDLHPGNVLFNGESLSVIDFDDCGFGPALYDFAVPIREMRELGLSAMEEPLLEGYREVRQIPGDLEKHLPLLLALRTAQLVVWMVCERKNPRFAARWEKWCRNELAELAENSALK